MRGDELKKGLWGYKKEGVYRYIMNLEEESSQKLAEKDEKMAQQEAQAQSRIGELERTVEALREENTSLKANQSAVFATLLEAQRYAERLREESARREQKAQEELKTKICRQTQMLERYSGSCGRCCGTCWWSSTARPSRPARPWHPSRSRTHCPVLSPNGLTRTPRRAIHGKSCYLCSRLSRRVSGGVL